MLVRYSCGEIGLDDDRSVPDASVPTQRVSVKWVNQKKAVLRMNIISKVKQKGQRGETERKEEVEERTKGEEGSKRW